MPNEHHKKLYKKDRLGNTRVWWVETDGDRYRTHSGLINGKISAAGWTVPTEKNIGKSNATSKEAQVQSEVAAMYVYQQHQGKYHDSVENIESGANFVECMLAEVYDPERHVKFPYLMESKLNGARCLAIDENTLQTRNGKLHVSCPHILEDVKKFQEEFPDYILDGELYNHDYHANFEGLMSLIRKSKNLSKEHLEETRKHIFLYVYDVIPPMPMDTLKRKQFLIDNVYGKYPSFRPVESFVVNDVHGIKDKLKELLDAGYEGGILRELGQDYQHRRVHSLVKVKHFMSEEVTILDVVEGKGTWSGKAKSVSIIRDNGIIQDSNFEGDFAFAKYLLDNKHEFINTRATVEYPEVTKAGKLKFPVISYFWRGERDV